MFEGEKNTFHIWKHLNSPLDAAARAAHLSGGYSASHRAPEVCGGHATPLISGSRQSCGIRVHILPLRTPLWPPRVTFCTQPSGCLPLFSPHSSTVCPRRVTGLGVSAGPWSMVNHDSYTPEYHPLDLGGAAALPSIEQLTEAHVELGWCPADGA